jgi:putative spermidine/putrescine transport system permease protein
MTESRWVRIALRAMTTLALAFIYLPIIVLAIYAFNDSRSQVWPPGQVTGFSLRWFGEAIGNGRVVDAFITSIAAATGATLLALVLGTLAAIGVARHRFFGREAVSFMLVLPIALPGVLTGIALAATFKTLGVDFGLGTIIVGHATFCVVIAYNNVVARLRRLPRSTEEASADLGADTWQTFRRVLLPGIRTALLSGGLLAFALSFDEVIVTNFTAGPGTETIPLWIFSAIQRPREVPVVNVVALALIVLSVVPVYIAERVSGAESAVVR